MPCECQVSRLSCEVMASYKIFGAGYPMHNNDIVLILAVNSKGVPCCESYYSVGSGLILRRHVALKLSCYMEAMNSRRHCVNGTWHTH